MSAQKDIEPGVARRGLMLVLSSPSGAGKTTLSKQLVPSEPQLEFSISVTTRDQRPGETNGSDYHFVSEERFQAMQAAGEFLESSEIYGHHYATPAQQTDETLAQGNDMLFELDMVGMRALKAARAHEVVSVFILPPSREELERRLRNRGRENDTALQKRLEAASQELSGWQDYDYVIINQDAPHALSQLRAILYAERAKRHRQHGLSGFVSQLLKA